MTRSSELFSENSEKQLSPVSDPVKPVKYAETCVRPSDTSKDYWKQWVTQWNQ